MLMTSERKGIEKKNRTESKEEKRCIVTPTSPTSATWVLACHETWFTGNLHVTFWVPEYIW